MDNDGSFAMIKKFFAKMTDTASRIISPNKTGGERIAKACENLFDLKNVHLNDEYRYYSLPICILDAVFSIGVRYSSTENTVKRYCDYYKIPRLRETTQAFPEENIQHGVSEFRKNIESNGFDKFASMILCNRQRTSAQNGILKAEAVYRWAVIFEKYGIETFQDLISKGLCKEAKEEILKIPGQKSGISLNYFFMLSGEDSLCKPDRHILSYLSEVLKENVQVDEAQTILTDAVSILKETYPQLSVRLLDYTIWNHMSSRK